MFKSLKNNEKYKNQFCLFYIKNADPHAIVVWSPTLMVYFPLQYALHPVKKIRPEHNAF